jgi:cytochrome c oxidase subunit 2
MPAPGRKLYLTMIALGLIVASCTSQPGAVQGREVSDLYRFFFIAAIVVFVITAGLIAWSLIRYRAKPGDDELPSQFHSNTALEVIWFAIPQILVIVLFVASAIVLSDLDDNSQSDDGAHIVNVEGFRWGWRFSYEEAEVTITGLPERPAEITLPVGEPVTFRLTSDDVQHSFFIPRFLIKRDVIPGRTNTLTVTIDEERTFRGVCAEFCGLLHAYMPFEIDAVPADDYQAWLNEQEGAADGNG